MGLHKATTPGKSPPGQLLVVRTFVGSKYAEPQRQEPVALLVDHGGELALGRARPRGQEPERSGRGSEGSAQQRPAGEAAADDSVCT